MKYYSEKDLNSILDIRDRRLIQTKFKPIDICFCRECELFEPGYWQSDSEVINGWCRGRSYYRTLDNEEPYYIYTNSDSFCDKDTVIENA